LLGLQPTSPTKTPELLVFKQVLEPCFKLILIGAEHDSVLLSSYAALTGWEVLVVASLKEEKTHADFPEATEFINSEAKDFKPQLDKKTAIILMTHSYVKDLQFLIALKNEKPAYLGLLGPTKRREKLFNELLERDSDVSISFLENIYGPAGIHLGAETPQEICISVLAEILSVMNKKKTISLKEIKGSIH